jgi:hypothetical protein
VARAPAADSLDRHELLAFVSPIYEDVALNELRDVASARLVRPLDRGALLVSTPHEAGVVAEHFVDRPPVFVRQALLDVTTVSCTDDLAVDARALASRCRAIGCGDVAICDLSGRRQHNLAELETAVRALLDSGVAGNRGLVVAIPGQYMVGIVLAGAGISGAPFWPGGRPELPFVQRYVSRSAFKLIEAINLFSIHIDPQAHALDLGAAPGGWSQVLAGYGMRVTAVDPGALDPQVASLPNVRTFAGTAQAFLRGSDERFDLVIDDMRLDARESARLLVAVQPLLRPSTTALITLKLPEHTPSPVLRHALAVLRDAYALVAVRCLFFNRNEVTVSARSRG